MRIVVVSDTHELHDDLGVLRGDVLLHCGDGLNGFNRSAGALDRLDDWFGRQEFDRIFESFYQVDNSSTREFGGAGLGLAIVRSFVEAHGGMVRVSSETGRGSRFTAVLPVTPPTRRPTTQVDALVAIRDRF